MCRDEALQVFEGDWLKCDFLTPPASVQVLGVNPSARSQERITFQVQAGKHGCMWIDAGWFSVSEAEQISLEVD